MSFAVRLPRLGKVAGAPGGGAGIIRKGSFPYIVGYVDGLVPNLNLNLPIPGQANWNGQFPYFDDQSSDKMPGMAGINVSGGIAINIQNKGCCNAWITKINGPPISYQLLIDNCWEGTSDFVFGVYTNDNAFGPTPATLTVGSMEGTPIFNHFTACGT